MEEQKTYQSPWLTFQEAADYLRLNKRTLQNYVNQRRITFHRSETGTKRFKMSDLDDFLKPVPRIRDS